MGIGCGCNRSRCSRIGGVVFAVREGVSGVARRS